MINMMDANPSVIIPFEYPNRSPLMVNARGIYLSFARLKASSGKAAKPVLAARTKISAVTA